MPTYRDEPRVGESTGVVALGFFAVNPLRRAFFRLQKLPMVFVASSSHSRSARSAMSSTALKNFTAFRFGRPNGRNLPALTRMVTASGMQFS
jgi:hypothetical protein